MIEGKVRGQNFGDRGQEAEGKTLGAKFACQEEGGQAPGEASEMSV